MSKELIERLRKETPDYCPTEAADLIEQQQSWIASLEQNARDADRMYAELETELAEQQKRIELYEQALLASWPDGAMGDAFNYWNAARREDV